MTMLEATARRKFAESHRTPATYGPLTSWMGPLVHLLDRGLMADSLTVLMTLGRLLGLSKQESLGRDETIAVHEASVRGTD